MVKEEIYIEKMVVDTFMTKYKKYIFHVPSTLNIYKFTSKYLVLEFVAYSISTWKL